MIYIMCLCVLPAYKYVICVTMCMQCPLSPGEGIRCPGTGVVYGYGLSCGCQESSPGFWKSNHSSKWLRYLSSPSNDCFVLILKDKVYNNSAIAFLCFEKFNVFLYHFSSLSFFQSLPYSPLPPQIHSLFFLLLLQCISI